LTPEGFLKLFVVIGRNGQGVGTSPFAAWVTNVENGDIDVEEKKVLIDRIDALYNQMDAGLSIYHLVALILSTI